MDKVLLIDIDSKISNIALMKISAYHKSIGDDVGFLNTNDPDIIYSSIIFNKNKTKCNSLKLMYPNSKILIGGSGYNINTKLPDYIESMKPDHSLYPNNKYSIGFASRGCNRKCVFCIVPQKEGKYKRYQHPEHWYNPKYKDIIFLDNNILFDKEYFMNITQWCIDKKLNVWFCQGLDIRLIDIDIIKRLLEIKTFKTITFAWDDIKDEALIKSKIQMLSDNGFTKNKFRSDVMFYVYIDSNEQYDNGVYRCRELKKLNINSFVMFNINKKRNVKIKHLI